MICNKIYIFLTGVFLVGCCCGSVEVEECTSEECSVDEISQSINNLEVEGAEYLKNVMKQLQQDRHRNEIVEVPESSNILYTQPDEYHVGTYSGGTPVYNISGPTPIPDIEAEIIPESPPPLSLTKDELMALYQAAITKASQLSLFQNGAKPVLQITNQPHVYEGHVPGQADGPVSGYYYYYFPIKSFITSHTKPVSTSISTSTVPPSTKGTPAPAHIHATITMIHPPNKSVEPLFMAISSFIGMALMFFFSVLFVPRLHRIRSKNAQFKDSDDDDFTNLGLILIEAMAGRDCSERFACEITKVFPSLKSNSKTLRVLEIILPPNLSQQVSQIKKAAGKRAKCSYIPCKIKKEKPPEKNSNQKPKVTLTAHDLWMQQFDKNKLSKKPQRHPNNQQQKKLPSNRNSNKKP